LIFQVFREIVGVAVLYYIHLLIPPLARVAKYWEKPTEFIPERFLGDWNKDALVAFSVGT
jgi:cytochrome P450